MIVFEKRGKENTEETAETAIRTAKERNLPVIAASNTGRTVRVLLAEARKQDYHGTIVMVSHVYGMKQPDFNELSDEEREALEAEGVKIVTAAHALSGAERGISAVFKGVYPVEIAAHTLRMFGAGVKVCVECALMACDAGMVRCGQPAVCVGGTGGGADTACVILPSYTAKLFDTKISEILCKPGLMEG